MRLRTRHEQLPAGPTRLDLTRRQVLLGAGAVGLLAACSGDDDTPTGEFSFEVEENSGPLSIVAAFPGGFAPEPAAFVAGIPQRLPFVLVDSQGPVREDAPDSVDVELRFNAEVIETVTLAKGGSGWRRPSTP